MVEHAGVPEPLFILTRSDLFCHFSKECLIEWPVNAVDRQFLQKGNKPAHHPAVSTAPEYLPAICFQHFFREIPMIAIKQVFIFIIQEIVSGFILPVHEFQVFIITCNG